LQAKIWSRWKLHRKIKFRVDRYIVLRFLNTTAIASGYAARDPQGGTTLSILFKLLKKSVKDFFSVLGKKRKIYWVKLKKEKIERNEEKKVLVLKVFLKLRNENKEKKYLNVYLPLMLIM